MHKQQDRKGLVPPIVEHHFQLVQQPTSDKFLGLPGPPHPHLQKGCSCEVPTQQSCFEDLMRQGLLHRKGHS